MSQLLRLEDRHDLPEIADCPKWFKDTRGGPRLFEGMRQSFTTFMVSKAMLLGQTQVEYDAPL